MRVFISILEYVNLTFETPFASRVVLRDIAARMRNRDPNPGYAAGSGCPNYLYDELATLPDPITEKPWSDDGWYSAPGDLFIIFDDQYANRARTAHGHPTGPRLSWGRITVVYPAKAMFKSWSYDEFTAAFSTDKKY